jgi:hypothetical protein
LSSGKKEKNITESYKVKTKILKSRTNILTDKISRYLSSDLHVVFPGGSPHLCTSLLSFAVSENELEL